MDPEEVSGAIFSGIVVSLLANIFFPTILELTIENTESLPLYMRILFLLFPIAILLVVVVPMFESSETLVAGFLAFLISLFVLQSVGVSEFAVALALIAYIAYRIWDAREE